MKLLNKFLFGSALIASFATLQACSEEDTLSGSDDIYIELSPTDIGLLAGDTTRISARVSNVSGHDINTPVTFSVDDASVARVVKLYKWVKESDVKPGDVVRDEASRADEDLTEPNDSTEVDNPEEPAEPGDSGNTTVKKVQIEDGYGIVGLQGAQNKSTLLRATLENGMFAVTPVSVVFRSVRKALTPGQVVKRSYQRQPNDTVWFNLNPIELIDEFTASYTMTLDEVHPGVDANLNEQPIADADRVFTFVHENPAENIVVDRELNRIGVVYTAPRICGKATCTMSLTNGEEDVECAQTIYIYPKVSPGFEVEGVRPLSQEANPSNPKVCLMSVNMDINSTYLIGACLGIEGGWDQDICNAYAAEMAKIFTWKVDGSSVIVKRQFADFDYLGGYVSYLEVQSGISEGLSVITLTMPDTTMVCNLSVINYNVAHPVDRIVVLSDGQEVDEVTFTLGQPASLDIGVEPDASFSYHIPEIKIADESILTVEDRNAQSGLSRTFKLNKPGVTYMTITSLDKTKTVKITVNDAVSRVALTPNGENSILIGETLDLSAAVYMASNTTVPVQNPKDPVEWVISDPNIAKLTVDASNQMRATVEGLTEGTVTVQAVCAGRRSAATTIKVEALSDIVLGPEQTESSIYDADENTIGLSIGDLFFEFPATYDSKTPNFVTDATGVAEINYGVSTYPNCPFRVVITAGADASHYIVNGTIDLPNGTHIILQNVVVEYF